MPSVARRLCPAIGCGAVLARGERCPTHGKRSIKPRNAEQRQQRQAMYGAGWAKASKAYLMRHPLCVMCEREGIAHSATVTDHIVPHRGDAELFWNEANWQALCKRHHDRKSLREEAMPAMRPEWLPLPACKVVLVCGAPGSGKSTYVERHRKPEDIVIDLDGIYVELTGETAHAPRGELLPETVRIRNERLASLAAESPTRTAWVIVCAPIRERVWWERKLCPQRVVVMPTSRAECEARIRADGERAAVREAQLAAVKRWWSAETGYAHADGQKRRV
jgi:5-methylcytosine-specific restriction protein A